MNESFIFTLIQNTSVIIASATAIYGITSWRKEAKWKRKYELAEEVLSLFYQCREQIMVIRSPFGFSNEGKSRKRSPDERTEESQILDEAYVFIERYEKEKAVFIKLFTLKYRFMAIFDKASGQPFDDLRKVINTIISAAHQLGGTYWQNQGRIDFTDSDFAKHLERMHKYEKIVWGEFDENDEIQNQVNDCVQRIESCCLSIIKK